MRPLTPGCRPFAVPLLPWSRSRHAQRQFTRVRPPCARDAAAHPVGADQNMPTGRARRSRPMVARHSPHSRFYPAETNLSSVRESYEDTRHAHAARAKRAGEANDRIDTRKKPGVATKKLRSPPKKRRTHAPIIGHDAVLACPPLLRRGTKWEDKAPRILLSFPHMPDAILGRRSSEATMVVAGTPTRPPCTSLFPIGDLRGSMTGHRPSNRQSAASICFCR